MDRFLWLTLQVLKSLLGGWPVTAILLLLIGIAGCHSLLFKRSQFRRRNILLLSPLLLSLLVLVWGTIMANSGTTSVPAWAYYVLGILCLLHLLVALRVIYLMRGLRWFAASVLLFELWVAFLCSLIAALSRMNVS